MAIYYNLTTFIPEVADVAIPRKAKVSTMPDRLQLNVHYYTNERHEIGITKVKEGKNRKDYSIYTDKTRTTGKDRGAFIPNGFAVFCQEYIDDVIVPELINRKITTRLSGFERLEVYTYSLKSTVAEKSDAILQRM